MRLEFLTVFNRLWPMALALAFVSAACAPPSSPAPPSPPPPSDSTPAPRAACNDGADNDGDGKIDYPADPGCFSATDTDEVNPAVGPGNAHRMIVWASYEKLVNFSDAQLDQWKARGADGFVMQTRYLDEIGGIEMWTGDPSDRLNAIVEGADVHERQRTLRDNRFMQRCHDRGLTVYLGMYLSNYHNLSTPLKVWNDDAGWKELNPIVKGFAGAAKLLGADGIATDSENYRDDSQTWNWNYPGVRQDEATVRSLARQRGREFMTAINEAFPNVVIVNYRLEVPGSWEERVQAQVNHVVGVWDKSVFVDFWGGIADAGGFSEIHFFDPIFYKSWHIRSGWDEALEYNEKGVRQTLSQQWANWEYAAPRFFLSPFAWIDPGPSAGSFDDARPPDYVALQLDAFHRWGEGNMFGLYTQHIDDFDYGPYVPAMVKASTPDGSTVAPAILEAPADVPAASLTVQRAEVPGITVSPRFLRIEPVASGLHEPMDAAFSPDGRLFIAEREGTIRIVRNGRLNANVALALDDAWTAGGNGLLAIAIDPQFERTHFVYMIYTAASRRDEPVFRLARFRELRDTLAERAVLLDAAPAARERAAAALRFGPDGKLYAAFDDGGDPRQIGNLASYNGKILRLNADGSTPSDQPMGTPVYASGDPAPRGLDWQPSTGTLWLTGRDVQNAGALAFYRGDLLVAGDKDQTLTRIRFDNGDPTRVAAAEPVIENAGAIIRALAVGPDGTLSFCIGGELVRLAAGLPGIPAR